MNKSDKKMGENNPNYLWLIGTGLCLFLLFLHHLVPTVYVHDAGELTAASWTLGIGHPPGAPLYMILSKLFVSFLPYGHIAWRYNLFSALCAVVAYVLMVLLSSAITGDKFAAICGGLCLVLTRVIWSQAETTEVYTLEISLLILFLLFYYRYLDGKCDFRIPAFVWGILLTCHVGLSPMTPIILVLVAWRNKITLKLFLWRLLQLVLILAIPIVLYFYVPIRSLANPPIDWGNPETVQNWIWHLTNRTVRERMLSLPLEQYWARTLEYGLIVLTNIHILLPLSLVGCLVGLWRKCRVALLLTVLVATDYVFVVFMDVAPLASEAYAIPTVIALVIFAMSGLSFVKKRPVLVAGMCLCLAAPLLSLYLNNTVCDGHNSFLVRDKVENKLGEIPENAVLFTQEDNTSFPLAYLKYVERAREDITVYDRQGNVFHSPYDRPLFLVAPGNLGRYRQEQEGRLVKGLLEQGKPVFFTSSFIDFEPSSWQLYPLFHGAEAKLNSDLSKPERTTLKYSLRYGPVPDWMSQQILAETALHKAHFAWSDNNRRATCLYLDEAYQYADIAELLLEIAQLAMKVSRHDIIQHSLEKAIRINPHFAPAYSLLGYYYFDRGKLGQAERYLATAIDKDPSLPQPYVTKAYLALGRNSFGPAFELFSHSLQLNPDQPDVLYNRALLSFGQKEYETSRSDMDRALRIKPDHLRARLLSLEISMKRDNPERAMKVLCETALNLDFRKMSAEQLKSLLIKASALGFPECINGHLSFQAGVQPDMDLEKNAIIKAYLIAHSAKVETDAP